MMARRFALGMLAVVSLALAGCASTAKAQDPSNTVPAVLAVAQRTPAPAVTGPLLDGAATFDLAAHKGDIVVINFWGSWCGPCVAEAGALEQVYKDSAAKGVTFVGVNVRDVREEAQQFAAIRLTYPSIFDPASKVALGFTVPPSTPSTYIVDRQGRLAVVVRRAVVYSELESVVTQLAAEPR